MQEGLISRVKQKLEELDMSPRDLSISAGLGQDFISELLRGRKNNVRSDNLDRIARVLQTSSQWLLTGSTEVTTEQPWAKPKTTTLPEIDVRGGAGGGGMVATSYATDENGNNVEIENVVATWSVPPAYLRGELRVDPNAINIIEVLGDSMTPSLNSGDRVFIDTRHTAPSPPGIYALHDGIGVIIKRIQLVPGTDPQRVLVISDNTSHRETELTLEEAHIIGRVVARVTAL